MKSDEFDSKKAREFLLRKEREEKEAQEQSRQNLLREISTILRGEFEKTPVEVFLVGSILRPFAFTSSSDIDVVLKNYKGDRFEYWAQLERKIGRDVEIILFETCTFQEFVLKDGLKVV
jgi:predicted nucleotidyltransferase